ALAFLLKPQPSIPRPEQFETIADSRLLRRRELCESQGAQLILLVPPTPSSVDAVRQMTMAAQRARVETLVPIDPAALSVRYYQSDELHLYHAGPKLFTSA